MAHFSCIHVAGAPDEDWGVAYCDSDEESELQQEKPKPKIPDPEKPKQPKRTEPKQPKLEEPNQLKQSEPGSESKPQYETGWDAGSGRAWRKAITKGRPGPVEWSKDPEVDASKDPFDPVVCVFSDGMTVDVPHITQDARSGITQAEDLAARRTKCKQKPKAATATPEAGKVGQSDSTGKEEKKESGEDAQDPRKSDIPCIEELMEDCHVPGEGFETKVQYKKQSKRNSIVALFHKADQGKWEQKVQVVCKDDRHPAWVAMLIVKRIQVELMLGEVDLLHLKMRKDEILAAYNDGDLLSHLHAWQKKAPPDSLYGAIADVLCDQAESLPVKQNVPANLRRSGRHISESPPGDREKEAPAPEPPRVLGNPDTCETFVEETQTQTA
ncbi:unnamed protein product [Symbiodinium sp. CCMP2592]|nr:unnamed protein product [Symbiodinium sp. CCMP2592]